MKLTAYPMPAFEIPAGKFSVFQTASPRLYRELVALFVDDSEQIQLFDDQDKPINCQRDVVWVGNPEYGLDYNAVFIKELTKQLITVMDDATKTAIIDAERELLRKIIEASFSLDVPLQVKESVTIESVIKAAGLRVEIPESTNICAKMELLFKILVETNSEKLVVLTDVSHFVDEQEFANLVEQVVESGLTVLLIEFSESSQLGKFHKCRYYYVDRDLVDFR